MTAQQPGRRTSDRDPNRANRMLSRAGEGLALAATITALSHAPAWLAICGLVTTVVLGVVDRLFPQESCDRLKWWRTVWTACRRS